MNIPLRDSRWSLVALLAVVGCSGEPIPETTPVTGVVTYKDKPVADATVSFVPVGEGGRAATAVTDLDGSFSVTTFVADREKEGAVPGDYAIAVTKMSEPAEEPTGTTQAEMQAWAAKGNVPKSLLPAMYKDPKKSQLKTTVEPGVNEPLKLELKD
jgi:hypothetical protein